MNKQNDANLNIRIPAELRQQAKKQTADRRGGISALVRELLTAWLKSRKPTAPRGRPDR